MKAGFKYSRVIGSVVKVCMGESCDQRMSNDLKAGYISIGHMTRVHLCSQGTDWLPRIQDKIRADGAKPRNIRVVLLTLHFVGLLQCSPAGEVTTREGTLKK